PGRRRWASGWAVARSCARPSAATCFCRPRARRRSASTWRPNNYAPTESPRLMGEAFADPAAVCATLAPLLLDDRRARIDAAAAARLGGLRLVIGNLHDPHNGAAVLR